MLNIREYVRPETLEQAYELAQDKNAVILGGMMWLRMQDKAVSRAIDLGALSLDKIEDTAEGIKIGAYVTLRELETSGLLNTYSCGAIRDAVKDIVGVQFRNTATIGGSVFGRYGFSDILTVFSAMGAEVELYKHGRMSMEEFEASGIQRDILTHIYLPKQAPKGCAYLALRRTATDFPVLNIAVCRRENIVCAVGARPQKAKCICFDDASNAEKRAECAAKAADELIFGTNARASAEYRKTVCAVLVRRALEKLYEGGRE